MPEGCRFAGTRGRTDESGACVSRPTSPRANAERVRRRTILTSLLAALSLVPARPALAGDVEPPDLLRTDSRAPYVHRLTLYAADGSAISPKQEPAVPYSPRATCGKCHPYAEIAHGWHFNAPDSDIPGGRPGEPWLLTDEATGTVLPITGRRWPETYAPADVGLTSWRFVLRFGAHTPGGGYGSPDDEAVGKSPEKLRWGISGRLEIDCMFCHSADQRHDAAEAARQIEAENFQWAPTVALGLALIRGEARKAPDDWDPLAPPNPDFPDQAGPKLLYDRSRFDGDDRVFFNITRRPAAERCYFCHSFAEVGPDAPDDLLPSRDVHLVAGLTCVDCHTNEVDHDIVRGYDTEARDRNELSRAAYSCAGCHLGEDSATDAALALGGRYRAPRPEHRGLPPIHFEKLTCTACHSGPWPRERAGRVQTAFAHQLGLPSRERTDDSPPCIIAPVFAHQPDGLVAAQRLVWPAFWGLFTGDAIRPLLPDAVRKAAAGALPRATATQPKSAELWTTERIGQVLAALATKNLDGAPVYVRDGHVFRHGATGALERMPHKAAAPYRWSFAHDVRPASQALGVRGCTDCHAADAPFYFGALRPAGITVLADWPAKNMLELRGDGANLARAWALGFAARPAFKWFAFACAVLVMLLGLRFLLDLLGERAASALPGTASCLTRFEHLVHGLAGLGLLVQAVTGFGPRLFGGPPREWLLFIHMLGAGAFVVGFSGTALQWSRRCRLPAPSALSLAQRFIFGITLLLGLAVAAPMLIAMLPVVGHRGQETLVDVHFYAALALLIAIGIHTLVSLAAARSRGRTP